MSCRQPAFLACLVAVLMGPGSGVAQDVAGSGPAQADSGLWGRPLQYLAARDTTFFVGAEAIFLDRSRASSHTLFTDLVNSSEAFNVRDLNWNYEFGPRITVGALGHSGWGVEGSWFQIDGWDSQAAVSGGLGQFQENFAGFTFGDIQEFRVSYNSELQNAEVNLRREVDSWLTLLAGVRWLELNETASVVADTVVLPVQDEVRTDTRNDLVGFQLGAIASLWNRSDRLRIDGIVKGGVYGVDADQRTTDVLGTTNPAGFSVSAGRNGTAFVGECGLNAVFRMTNCLSVQAGYNVFLLSGVALAPDQWNNVDLTIPTADIDSSGTLVAHGGTVGLVWLR